ncbi:SprT family protein [Brevibacillus borstelensis]|uniref:SprT family protein n=1 Tax=Brevibacillus borstelensis TaxID=45462 RepID=UPI0014902106|nr:SprT family protein [Brevibacillus borstelensis]MCC0566831.1 SprT family protein [Brevibacillus borstelensis]MCM3561336.1 SprT family protein [Brevibacillus borstelensis]MCM3593091.1 SprT family protein [Brevibacillus borstelensis]MED1853934.1 SprT family protein [Brevibacillus borstelensis]NOU56567.1 SprT family protein [Brevibacillus borstelensis]
MTDQELQALVEAVSAQYFARPFRHQARFNSRLRTTGGRYLLRSHDIEINPRHLEQHGEEELIGIVKHELCHYHLHLEKKGYQHKDRDFQELLKQVGGSRYCQEVGGGRTRLPYRYELVCEACQMRYKRKRKINPARYRCGRCSGKLRLYKLETAAKQQG